MFVYINWDETLLFTYIFFLNLFTIKSHYKYVQKKKFLVCFVFCSFANACANVLRSFQIVFGTSSSMTVSCKIIASIRPTRRFGKCSALRKCLSIPMNLFDYIFALSIVYVASRTILTLHLNVSKMLYLYKVCPITIPITVYAVVGFNKTLTTVKAFGFATHT